MAEANQNAGPTARIVRSRAALAEAVANWPGAAVTSTWALVGLGEIPTATELAALREAAKLCDKVAAIVVTDTPAEPVKTLPTFPKLVRDAGADVVWVPVPDKALLQVAAGDGTSLRLLLQALLAVLPSAVVVNRADMQRVRQWRLLQAEFGEVVELVLKG